MKKVILFMVGVLASLMLSAQFVGVLRRKPAW